MDYRESYTTELKEVINSDFKKEIIAFANAGVVYIRHGITSGPASDEMIRQMIKDNDGKTFDKARSINQELSFNYAERYFNESNVPFKENNKKTLKLIDGDGYYTNAALLLSEQCEHTIKCAVYSGTGKTKFQTRKEFTGSVLRQVDEAYEYINLFNNKNSTIENLKRVEHPDYPRYAIKEALLNTIVHREYDYSGSILINIFDDRIEFVSIGGLVKGLTLIDIMGGVSQTRNTIVANIFYRLKLIESYGTGIQRIIESYEGKEIQPTFSPRPASFLVIIPNMNYIDKDVKEETLSNENKVLNLLQAKVEIKRRDVEKLLGCSAFPATNILNNLIKDNKIIRTGTARNTKYILK